jgi:hypothetical protein
LLLSCLAAVAKDKKKALLPEDVLRARTALVIIDPNAGIDAQDPGENRMARENVEKALAKWGRLEPLPGGATADLIIVIRKGNGKLAQGTIGGTGINANPPMIGQSSDSTIHVAGHEGNTRIDDPSDPQWNGAGSRPTPGTASSGPYPQAELGSSQDSFVVYRGNGSAPLDAPAVWRYSATDALAAPDLPAVQVFRKLVAESEKQLVKGP